MPRKRTLKLVSGVFVWYDGAEFHYYDEKTLKSASGSGNFICSSYVLQCSPEPRDATLLFDFVRQIELSEV